MNLLEEIVIRAVAEGKVARGTVMLAKRMIRRKDLRAAAAAGRAPVAAAPLEKAEIPSIVHHEKLQRAQAYAAEEVASEVWGRVLERSQRDHGGKILCESCHKWRDLEPHHLVLGERTNKPHLVMALCAKCHRTGNDSAHLAPRRFAQTVVIPWAKAHNFELPNRKEYRT